MEERPRSSEGEETSRSPDVGAAVKRVVRPIVALLALVFIVFAAWDLYQRWDRESRAVTLSPPELVGAFAFASLAMLFQFAAWRALIRHLTGVDMPGLASAKLYLDSQLARYTPGKVGLPVVRIAGARAVGVEPGVMGAALLVEILSWCGVGSVVGAGALFAFGAGFVRGDGGSALLSVGSMVVAAGSALGVLVLLVLDRGRLPARIRAQFPRGEGSIVPVALPAWHLLHFLAWVASGALLGLSVGAATSAAFAIGGLLCVAIVGGFVALFAPAGAGVREAMVALGAAPLVGAPAAITISIVGRAISLLSDVALFGYFRWRARQASGR